MEKSITRVPDNSYGEISNKDVLKALGHISKVVELVNAGFELKKTIEYEETARTQIISDSQERLAIISREFDLFELDLLADIDRTKKFVDDSMSAIHKLIDKGDHQAASMLHECVMRYLQGKASMVVSKFNQNNASSGFRIIEE